MEPEQQEDQDNSEADVNQEEGKQNECPVCNMSFEKVNQLMFYYNNKGSVRNPELVTSMTHKCPVCKLYFGKQTRYHLPNCPASDANRQRLVT